MNSQVTQESFVSSINYSQIWYEEALKERKLYTKRRQEVRDFYNVEISENETLYTSGFVCTFDRKSSYMLSVLQAFFGVQFHTESLLKLHNQTRGLIKTTDLKIMNNLFDYIIAYKRGNNKKIQTSIDEFVRNVQSYCSPVAFSSDKMHDAYTFLVFLFNYLDMGFKQIYFIHKPDSEIENIPSNYFQNDFRTTIVEYVKCRSNNEHKFTRILEEEALLKLKICDHLADSIANFFKNEFDDFNCPECKSIVRGVSFKRLENFKRSIMMTLNIFEEKNESNVKHEYIDKCFIPVHLNLDKYLTHNDHHSVNKYFYFLNAIIFHVGKNFEDGRYTSRILIFISTF